MSIKAYIHEDQLVCRACLKNIGNGSRGDWSSEKYFLDHPSMHITGTIVQCSFSREYWGGW